MKLRSLITGAIALALVGVGSLHSPAQADEFDADVGGGVATIQAVVKAGAPAVLRPVRNADYAQYTVTYGRTVLGSNGGRREASVLNKTVGPVSVKASSNVISGNRNGLPYATAQTVLTGINITGINTAGIKLGVLDTSCTWDRTGPRGETTVTDLNGKTNKPAKNSVKNIPGVGYVVFNEQYIQNHYVLDPATNTYKRFEVIFVYGAHLYLYGAAQAVYGTTDIILGFTSCDPVKLPSLSGLQFGSNYS
ncbi:MAG: hypothetical protein H0U92_09505 [Actinobacteria bacterium]|nr:hypothetical protein [Actinomycetota bacterium]